MPTSWTGLSQTGAGWQEGEPHDDAEDFFIDVLFEGTQFFAVLSATYVKASVAAASYTEASIPASTWTELTG